MNSKTLHGAGLRLSIVVLASVALAGCSGGGGNPGSVRGTSGDLVVLRTTPKNNGLLFLNEEVAIDFSNPLDLASVDLNTVNFSVFDLAGNPLDETPTGRFRIGTSPDDETAGRRLVFAPRFPTSDDYLNGGFRPARRYIVQLPGGDARNNSVLKDVAGRGLVRASTFEFRTVEGATPAQLFSDTRFGGPRRADFAVVPTPGTDGAQLNNAGLEQVEVRLTFDQPLNPASSNLPVRISVDPLVRASQTRGRIYLEYDDPVFGQDTWIPATVDLESNTRSGSVIVLRPIGLLPNAADIRVIVEPTLEDMSGESNARDGAYNRVFASFRTRSDFAPSYDAVVERFDADHAVDMTAPFLEPQAQVANGKLNGNFGFQGRPSQLVFRPSDREVELNTNFTTVRPVGAAPVNVSGGVFNFGEVEIPDGVLVRGSGTNPMIFLVSGDVTINGVLSVDGGLGARVDTLNSANFPTSGGIGVCGGGNGGRGSPNGADRSPRGENGFGPRQKPSGGGEGGGLGCLAGCNRGSAGGGGSFGSAGDPYYPPNSTATWPQVTGRGGQGCLDRSLRGGAAGPRPFVDSRIGNDFWGLGVDNNFANQVRIVGELAAPIGGAGGGGGGDRSNSCRTGDPGFVNDNKGGGGGGGAGALVIQALGKIRIGRRGKISAEGGSGGGGEQAGGNNEGGGGGGGSGGLIVLMSATGIEIQVHGNEISNPPKSTYGELDYDFAISADGGIGTQGEFGGVAINRKYNPPGTASWNAKPAGAFGGLGVVQLMVPPGDDNERDASGQPVGTGNSLDDNIEFYFTDSSGGRQVVSPARKVALLGWRGWPDRNNSMRNERNEVINLGKREGDIRPSPIMLPAPFGAVSRAQSIWMDLGAANRVPVTQPDGSVPRVVRANAQNAPRPDFEFGGTGAQAAGYLNYGSDGQPSYPPIDIGGDTSFPIASVSTNASYESNPAYEIRLANDAKLGSIAHRYSHYRLEFVAAPDRVLGDLPILGHVGSKVWVEASGTLPTGADTVRVIAKFLVVEVDGQPGLGGTFEQNGRRVPANNVRVGFAFHTDPTGSTADRYPNPAHPATLGELFAFDLTAQSFQDYLNGTGTGSYATPHRPTYVKYDVLFNTRFDPTANNNNNGTPLTAEMPTLRITELRLPYRY